MRKKSFISLITVSSFLALTLASCNSGQAEVKPTDSSKTKTTDTSSVDSTTKTSSSTTTTDDFVEPVYVQDTLGLDIYINYDGTSGISARQQFLNPVEGTNYNQNEILPVWKYFGNTVKTDIREASGYKSSTDDQTYKLVKSNDFKSDTDTNQKIDLFYNTTDNINKMGNSGEAVDLMKYIKEGKMPYFSRYLDKHPEVKAQITQGSDEEAKIYYTPYFDGYNDYEKSLVMNTVFVEEMVDTDDFTDFDSTVNGGATPDSNTLQKGSFKPFMDDNYNYPTNQTVNVSVNSKLEQITINKTDNIIKQQNNLLQNGCTGQELAQQFKTYLTAAYGDNVGQNKTYKNYSEIFTSESACYNTDDLIALMRVIKANPGVITGDDSQEIEILFPRGAKDNRINNVLQFASVFGVQGVCSEYDNLYVDGNGKITDGGVTMQNYEAVNLLSQLYDEGLIQPNFYSSTTTIGDSGYLQRYFGHLTSSTDSNYGFITFDYSASTGAMNSQDASGVGTIDSQRAKGYQNEVTGIQPVLPPLTYWQTEAGNGDENITASISSKNNKTLIRYSEDNRSIKENSWCIPKNSDNKEKAVQLMDYLFSEAGNMVNDFGTTDYWSDEFITYQNELSPQLSDQMKSWLKTSGIDFWSFMRQNIGATHGIGSIREASLNYFASNQYTQTGIDNIENAISSGALKIAKVSSDYAWGVSVPSVNYATLSSNKESYDGITQFWAVNKCSTVAFGWVKVVVDEANIYTVNNSQTTLIPAGYGITGKDLKYKDILNEFGARKTDYLYTLLSGSYRSLMPDYIK